MADPLHLSLWFPNFDVEDVLPHVLKVLRLFPFSEKKPGIGYVSLHPVSWNEATVLEQRFTPGISPEQAILVASEFLHEDYAYRFEADWDLWTLREDTSDWALQPSPVTFVAHGREFDEGVFEHDGHILIDFGLDTPFVQEQVQLTVSAEDKVRANVQKLVDFSSKIEQASGASARLLWSESEENLAQKLIARLQKVQ